MENAKPVITIARYADRIPSDKPIASLLAANGPTGVFVDGVAFAELPQEQQEALIGAPVVAAEVANAGDSEEQRNKRVEIDEAIAAVNPEVHAHVETTVEGMRAYFGKDFTDDDEIAVRYKFPTKTGAQKMRDPATDPQAEDTQASRVGAERNDGKHD